jgi:hypothetical protein
MALLNRCVALVLATLIVQATSAAAQERASPGRLSFAPTWCCAGNGHPAARAEGDNFFVLEVSSWFGVN